MVVRKSIRFPKFVDREPDEQKNERKEDNQDDVEFSLSISGLAVVVVQIVIECYIPNNKEERNHLEKMQKKEHSGKDGVENTVFTKRDSEVNDDKSKLYCFPFFQIGLIMNNMHNIM